MCIVLESVETFFQHILWTKAFNAEQVEYHVVAQVESRVHAVRLALDHVLGRLGLHLFVDHHNNNTACIEATTTGTT